MTMKQFLDGFDLLVDRLTWRFRKMLRVALGGSALFELLHNTELLKLPEGSKWAKWVSFGTIVIAYYTRSKSAGLVPPPPEPAKSEPKP